MGTALRWLSVLVLGLAAAASIGVAKMGGAPATALVGYPSGGSIGEQGLNFVKIVGGCAGKRGWVGSTDAKGLPHKGDRLPVYALKSGRVGSALLTDDGTVYPRLGPGRWPTGLWLRTRVQFSPGKEAVQEHEPLIALWHAAGTPEPRWVPAKEMEAKGRASRRVVTEWLRQRGYPRKQIDAVQVCQIVQADVNGDGRSDTLLSFDWFDLPGDLHTDPVAYLLLRYQPSGAGKVQTVVVAAVSEEEELWVAGLRDLDRDGWAEVIVAHPGLETWGRRLYYHTPEGFKSVRGELMGV